MAKSETLLYDVLANVTPAPGRLEVVRQFVNTTDFENEIDDFETAAGVRRWLFARQLVRRGEAVSERDRLRLIELREALRALAEAHNGAPLPPRALARLNRQAAQASIAAVFDSGDDVRLTGRKDTVDDAVSSLLAIVCEAIADGTWSRLKACRSGTCRWAFYDASRNRVGTWCSMAVCGNRAKARSYRERHRQTAGS
jgi:predicted RNA-binding Zn ribbon-like protein